MINPIINTLRTVGTLVRYNHLLARSHPVGPNYVALNFENDEIPPVVLSDVELEEAYGRDLSLVHDKKTTPNHAVTLTAKQKTKLFKIEAYLDTLYKMGGRKGIIGGIKLRKKVIEIASKQLNDDSPPSPAQLAIWAQEQRDYVGGVSAKISTAVRHKRLSKFEEIQAFAIEVADEFIFGKFTSFQYFYDIFVTRAEKIFKTLPSRETVRKWLEQIICPKKKLKEQSRAERRRELRNAIKKFKTTRPYERLEGDACSMRVGVKDDEGNYLGQATVIFFLDVHTRSVAGYELHIGAGEPSSSVVSAFRHAVCKKEPGTYHSLRNNYWYCSGPPEKTAVDGGAGFISKETQSYMSRTVGTVVDTLPSYSPWLKPFIERFIYTFRTNCEARLPGYVGKQKDQAKLEHKIKERAYLTVDELRRAIESWIVDEYHHKPHSGINGLTPYQAWEKARKECLLPVEVKDEYKVRLPKGKKREATISGDAFHLGVTINRIRYNDDDGRLKEIGYLLAQTNKTNKVTCFYSDCDLSAITVLCPTTLQQFKVPAIDENIKPGMSLIEYQALRPSTYKKKGFSHHRTMEDNPEITQGHEAVNKIVGKKKTTKLRRTSIEDIQNNIDTLAIENYKPTDIDPYVDEIDWDDIEPLPQS